MITVTPNAEERLQECFNPRTLSRAIEALRRDGFVIVDDVIAHEHLDILQGAMEEDLVKILALPVVPHNFVWGIVQQGPPPYADYVFRDVLANPFVCQITRDVLGEGACSGTMTGNSNLPGSGLQPVHVDDGQLWADLEIAHPPTRLVVNVSLANTTVENGAIELWPGTHLDTRQVRGSNIRVAEDAVEERRNIEPPVRGITKKGAVLIRDIRVWHRGTPNKSDDTRFMIGMIHSVPWFAPKSKKGSESRTIGLDKRSAHVFDGCVIENVIPFVDEPGDDYLSSRKPYDYDGPN